MFLSDSLDMLLYLMQLGVIQARKVESLKKYVANLYFFECIVWTLLHVYDFITKRDIKTGKDLWKKKLNIIKYALDSTTSHNDFSGRRFNMEAKPSSTVGLISSVVGMILVWT